MRSTAASTVEPMCPHCHGVGVVPLKDKPGTFQTCECNIRAEIRQYLGPYLHTSWNKAFNPAPLGNKNILYVNFKEEQFHAIIKAFLLNTPQRYKHLTHAPFAIVDSYYTSNVHHQPLHPLGQAASGRSADSFGTIREIELLIIRCLGTDPKHGQYGSILTSLLQERTFHKRPTWLYSKYPLQSATFTEVYGDSFAAFLDSDAAQFLHLKQQF